MMCPNCRAKMQFDESRDIGFCPYCGGKVSRGFSYVQNIPDQPNVFISFSSINPAVGMVTRIVSTGVKNTYVNGQTISFHLAPGPQNIVLKIGRKNYGRNIVVPSDNTPVRIYASYDGRARIAIDQPPVYSTQTESANIIQRVVNNPTGQNVALNTPVHSGAINQANTTKTTSTRRSGKAFAIIPLAALAAITMLLVGTLYKNLDKTSVLSNDVGELSKTKICHAVDVTGMALSDAEMALEKEGFTNLRGEPFDDIEDKDNWIVTAQSKAPGLAAKSDELIILDCDGFDDYVNDNYSGKNIVDIQKLAKKSGFNIKYQDSSSNELDLSSLTNDVKKDVIASSACQYNEAAKTAIVTVAYAGNDPQVVLPAKNAEVNAVAPTAVPTETPTPTPTVTLSPTPTPIPKNKITKITLENDGDIELHISGDSYEGTAAVTKKYPYRYVDTNVVFVSENPKVATIKSLSQKVDSEMKFEISPVSVGETYVYAKTSDGYITSNRIKVVVKPPVMAESIELSEDEIELYVNDVHYLKAYISPENTANKRVTWSSSDTSVVTVTGSGTLRAISCGEAVVTAKTTNGLTASCYVTVVMEAPEEDYSGGGYDYGYGYDDSDYDYDYDDSDYYDDYYEEDYYTEYVWLSATGSKYHSKPNCGRMNPDNAYQVTLDYALENGYDACKKCH